MGLFKSLFNKKIKEEYTSEISMKINSEQYEYDNLYYSINKEKELKKDLDNITNLNK